MKISHLTSTVIDKTLILSKHQHQNKPGAEDLSAVSAVVPSLGEREAYPALQARLRTIILHPVVDHAARLVGHRPAVDTSPRIPHVHRLVVPGGGMQDYFIYVLMICTQYKLTNKMIEILHHASTVRNRFKSCITLWSCGLKKGHTGFQPVTFSNFFRCIKIIWSLFWFVLCRVIA